MAAGKTSVSRQVVEYLHRHIVSGAWKVGEKIPSENVLSRELGVSRVTVRLAIQQFIGLGILESFHGKGTFLRSDDARVLLPDADAVPPGDVADMRTLLEYRLTVEPGTCRLAVERADGRGVAVLQGHLDALVANIGNSREFVHHDVAFHREIGRMSGNALLAKGLNEVFVHSRRDHENINAVFGYKDGVYYHSLILRAFERRDAALAGKLMAEHLRTALDQLANSRD